MTRIAPDDDARWRLATEAAHPHGVHFVVAAMRFVATLL
jgi:hypothetical protein